jgi:hypothetical protein
MDIWMSFAQKVEIMMSKIIIAFSYIDNMIGSIFEGK